MKLVRFGKRTINMDQVVEIVYAPEVKWNPGRSDPAGYKLYTNQILDMTPSYIWIDGADAIALELWLATNSEDARESMLIAELEDEGAYLSAQNQIGAI